MVHPLQSISSWDLSSSVYGIPSCPDTLVQIDKTDAQLIRQQTVEVPVGKPDTF